MNLFLRRWHRWISALVMMPLLLVVVTGIALSLRGYVNWVQPKYPAFKSELTLSFPEILEIVKMIPEGQIKSWSDVSQIDIRPANGNIRVRSKFDNWEIQLKGDTGEVMSSAPRRVSWLVKLHEGSFFGDTVRYGWFLPSAIGLLFLWFSGVWLLFSHYRNRYLKFKK